MLTPPCSPDPPHVLQALQRLVEFAAVLHDPEPPSVAALRVLALRITAEPWEQELRREVDARKDEAFLETRERIFEGRTAPGMTAEETLLELQARTGALFDALRPPPPPPPPDLDISACPGAEQVEHRTVLCRGNPTGACAVVAGAVAVVQDYVGELARNDLEAAYGRTDAGLRAAMDLDAFVAAHRQAERRYGGPVVDFAIERLAYVLTDDAARRGSSTRSEGWHRGTRRQNRRCRLVGFCRRAVEEPRGCRAAFWIAEDETGYRIANFDFYD